MRHRLFARLLHVEKVERSNTPAVLSWSSQESLLGLTSEECIESGMKEVLCVCGFQRVSVCVCERE